jgi:hypothetical protein
MGDETMAAKRGLRLAALAAGAGGALLFPLSIRAAGASAVHDGVGRVGWWFVVILHRFRDHRLRVRHWCVTAVVRYRHRAAPYRLRDAWRRRRLALVIMMV